MTPRIPIIKAMEAKIMVIANATVPTESPASFPRNFN
jgi:hypothetical protein